MRALLIAFALLGLSGLALFAWKIVPGFLAGAASPSHNPQPAALQRVGHEGGRPAVQAAPPPSAAAESAIGPDSATAAVEGAADRPRVTATAPGVRWAGDLDRERAEQMYASATAALRSDPTSTAALRDAARAARQLERWDECITHLKALAAALPDDQRVPTELATLLMQRRRWLDALPVWRSLLERRPDDPAVRFNYALALTAARHLADAHEAWNRVLELTPENVLACAHRAEVRLDLHEWAPAAEDLQRVLEADPGDIDAALNLALAQRKLGRFADARATVQRVAAQRPRHVPTLNRLAEFAAAAVADDADGAAAWRALGRDWCERSLKLDPRQADVEALRGRLNAE